MHHRLSDRKGVTWSKLSASSTDSAPTCCGSIRHRLLLALTAKVLW